MSNFINREALYNAYVNSNEHTWAIEMGRLAHEGSVQSTTLYYLSTDAMLENDYVIDESFDDRYALQHGNGIQEVFTIPLPQRLMVGSDYQACWNQSYNKLSQVFTSLIDTSTPIELYLYVVDVSNCVIIDNQELVDNNIVHNAFTSNIHAVFGHPKLKLVEKIFVENTFNYPDETCTYYHPFNDNRYAPVLLSTPLVIKSKQAIS